MSLFFVSYDIRKRSGYDRLYKLLDELKAVRILESTWCFHLKNSSVEDLKHQFKKAVDHNDGFIISEVSNWASFKTIGVPGRAL